MRIAITAITWLGAAAVSAWGWVSQGWDWERGVTVLGAELFGWFANWLYYKVGELERRVEHLEKADLVERLHKVEWKLYGLPRG
jgi:hypothetical protein